MIEDTDAIVLSTRRYSESSKIATLYTRSRGKTSVIARGAMQPRNRFGSLLQPFAVLATTIYLKEGRDLQTLSGAETLKRFGVLMRDLERMSVAMELVELVDAVVQGQEPNDVLFETIITALVRLDDKGIDPQLSFVRFMVETASILGYAIRTEECGVCDEPVTLYDSGVPYSIPAGAPLCREHGSSSGAQLLSVDTMILLQRLTGDEEFADVGSEKSETLNESRELLLRFFQYHVDGLRRLRAGKISSAIARS